MKRIIFTVLLIVGGTMAWANNQITSSDLQGRWYPINPSSAHLIWTFTGNQVTGAPDSFYDVARFRLVGPYLVVVEQSPFTPGSYISRFLRIYLSEDRQALVLVTVGVNPTRHFRERR